MASRTTALTRRELLKRIGVTTVQLHAAWSHSRFKRTPVHLGHTSRAPKKEEEGADTLFFDQLGLIVQQDGDGGDTAQREGWTWFGSWVRSSEHINEPWDIRRRISFEQAMAYLEVGQTGIFRRHPDPRWSDPGDFSRDQTIPIVAAMGVLDDGVRLQRFYHELRRRNWMAQNGKDTMGDPIHRNLVARARDEEPDRFGDLLLFGAAETRIEMARNNKNDVGDDLNLLVILLLATVRKPNDLVHKAREYYAKNRPDNYGMFLGSYRNVYETAWNARNENQMIQRMEDGISNRGWKPDCPRILGALRWYFRAEQGGSPSLAELYEPIVRKWFQ